LDLREATDIRRVVREVAPTMIFTRRRSRRERAESDEAERSPFNGAAVEALARASCEARAVLVHYSTDYVFGWCSVGTRTATRHSRSLAHMAGQTCRRRSDPRIRVCASDHPNRLGLRVAGPQFPAHYSAPCSATV